MDDSQRHPEVAARPRAKRVARRWPLVSGIAAVLLAAALGAIVVARDGKLDFDTEWRSEVAEDRGPVLDILSYAMNVLGGNFLAVFVIPTLIIVVLLTMKRPWAAAYYLAATLVSSGLVQLLKKSFGRARPEDILVNTDFGSFPSGHVGNAATMVVILAILFPRVWVWVAGAAYLLLMMFSRTYLGAHWLSDTIGGALLGVGVAIAVWAPFAAKLDGEREMAVQRHLAKHPAHPTPHPAPGARPADGETPS